MSGLLTFDILVGAIDNGHIKSGALFWLGNIVILLVTGMFLYRWTKNYIQVDDDAHDRKVSQLSEDGHLIRELKYRHSGEILAILASASVAWFLWCVLYVVILTYGAVMAIILTVVVLMYYILIGYGIGVSR